MKQAEEMRVIHAANLIEPDEGVFIAQPFNIGDDTLLLLETLSHIAGKMYNSPVRLAIRQTFDERRYQLSRSIQTLSSMYDTPEEEIIVRLLYTEPLDDGDGKFVQILGSTLKVKASDSLCSFEQTPIVLTLSDDRTYWTKMELRLGNFKDQYERSQMLHNQPRPQGRGLYAPVFAYVQG